MKFKELLDAHTDEDVEEIMKVRDGKNLKGYALALKTLRMLVPRESKMRICLHMEVNSPDDTPWVSVSGKDGTTQKEMHDGADGASDEEGLWAIEYTHWTEWLAMEIDPGTLDHFHKHVILGECLYEMTFSGYSPAAVEDKLTDLQGLVDEAKDALED